MNTLHEVLRPFRGKARQFLILRISGIKKKTALEMARGGISDYNRWLIRPDFVEVHRQIQDLFVEHRDEALRMLRKENQLNAALMEGELIVQMRGEIESGDYHLLRTGLARELYARLMSEMDKTPDTQIVTWEQRIQNNQLFMNPAEQLPAGEEVPYEEV